MRKNILLFVKNLQGRGVSKVYLNLSKAFRSYGYNTYIIIRENIIDFNISGQNVVIFEKNITKNIDDFIEEKHIDFIISNNVKFLENIKNLSQDNIYYSVHMLWSERIFKNFRFKKLWELKKEYKNKNIIAVSKAVEDDLLKKIKIKPKKIEIIHDIFDFHDIDIKSKEFIPEENSYILNIGAFSKEKNHKLLLEVYKSLDTNLNLVLIGKGKLEKKIKDYAKKLGIEEKVKFLGFQKNPYPYIKNAKLMLLTSKDEALPGVAIESLYLNTPVVSTDSKGIRDILTNEFESFICKNKNELIQKTKMAMQTYPKINKNKIIKEFGFDIIKKYIYLIRRKNEKFN